MDHETESQVILEALKTAKGCLVTTGAIPAAVPESRQNNV